jgi:hypothetical protein
MQQVGKFWAVVFVVFGCSVVSGCSGSGGASSGASGGGSGGASGGGSGGANGGGSGGANGGGSGRSTGGSPTAPIACSPDISGQMVPCDGTPAKVPTRTKRFSVTGPFSAGESVAVSVRASSGLGLNVQAFAESAACDDSMTLIGEVVVPNGDYSCAEVTLTEATQAVRFELLDDSVTYPALHAVCGGCP